MEVDGGVRGWCMIWIEVHEVDEVREIHGDASRHGSVSEKASGAGYWETQNGVDVHDDDGQCGEIV
jgi:hypothetical protein